MQGFAIIAGQPVPLRLHPGPRLPDGRAVALEGDVLTIGDRRIAVDWRRDGHHLWVKFGGQVHEVLWRDAVSHLAAQAHGEASGEAHATMPGTVIELLAASGDRVNAGDVLLVIESMKLETPVRATVAGRVTALPIAVGESFQRGALLAVVEEEE